MKHSARYNQFESQFHLTCSTKLNLFLQGSEPSTMETNFKTADEAIHACVLKFNINSKEENMLMNLRTGIFRIIRYKALKEVSKEESQKESKEVSKDDLEVSDENKNSMNNLKINIYCNKNRAFCTIGKGGKLLVLNVINQKLQYEWNDTIGVVKELSDAEIKLFQLLVTKVSKNK